MYKLKGKTALITGGAKRLGRSLAIHLAKCGMNVVLHYNRSQDTAETVRGQIRATGAQCWLVPGDLAHPAEAETVVKRACDHAGSLQVLVNNASIFPRSRITEFGYDHFLENIQVNALSPLLLARSFAAQTQTGAIVNFLDSRVAGTDPAHAAYFLSKRVLLDITRMLALELAPGIRVSGVAPGLILPPPGEDQTYLELQKHTVPLADWGKADHINETVRFLLTNDFVTGQVIFVDGGRHLMGGSYEPKGDK